MTVSCKGATCCAPTPPTYLKVNLHHVLRKAATLWAMIILICILSACNALADTATASPEAATAALPDSDWGTVELIAQAEQIDAPIFMHTGNTKIFTWTGSQDAATHHFARGIEGNTETLALPAFYPQQETLLPINRGALKLWLDRNNSDTFLQLHMATISYEGQVLEGIIPVSTQRTRNYTAIAISQHQFRVVWSGGLGEVTNLYLHQVDDSGRLSGGDLLQIDADYPALIRDTDDNVHLFWLSNNGRDAYHAHFDELGNPSLIDIQRIASANLDESDAVTDFTVAYDGTDAYLLWTIHKIDDEQLVLMSSGQLNDERFSSVMPLLTQSDEAIQWINPPRETQSPLPLVANSNQQLVLLWMQNGQEQETENIVESGRLIGLPYIETSPENISISWSQATPDGYANLFLLSRPRNP